MLINSAVKNIDKYSGNDLFAKFVEPVKTVGESVKETIGTTKTAYDKLKDEYNAICNRTANKDKELGMAM